MKPNLVLDEEDKRIRFRNYSDYSLQTSTKVPTDHSDDGDDSNQDNDQSDLALVSDEEEEEMKKKKEPEEEEEENTSIFPELTGNFDEEIIFDDPAHNESSIDPETGEIIQPGISISMLESLDFL